MSRITTTKSPVLPGKIIQLIRDLTPSPPRESKDGPCCYSLTPLSEGRERYVGQGCECGNYDDAQAAAGWAEDENRWLDAKDFFETAGLDIEEYRK